MLMLLPFLLCIETVSPTKSVGRAAVLKPIGPLAPGVQAATGSEPEQISVAELATAL